MAASAWTPVDETAAKWTPVDEPQAQPDAATRLGSNLLSGAGVMSKEDTKTFFTHPLDALKQMAQSQGELAIQAKKELQNKDYVRGLTHAVEYLIPGMGPNLAQAGKQLEQGDIAGGVGRTLGAAIPIVAGSPEVAGLKAKIPTGTLPERMYQSALKPSTTINPAQVKSMVQTGLQNEIPVSEAGATKLSGLITDLNDKIKTQIQSGSNAGATVNKFAVASRLGDAAKRFQTQVNPEADLNAISESGNEFLRNQPAKIPAADAQALKQGTYAQLKDKSFGEMQTATKEAQKALARGIKEELNKKFPELQSMNARDSQFYQLDNVLEKAVQRQSNHQLIGLGTPAAAAAGGLMTGTGAGAMAGAILKAVIDDPVMKSRLAIVLSKAGKGMSVSQANARVAAYSSALASSAQQRDGQNNEQ